MAKIIPIVWAYGQSIFIGGIQLASISGWRGVWRQNSILANQIPKVGSKDPAITEKNSPMKIKWAGLLWTLSLFKNPAFSHAFLFISNCSSSALSFSFCFSVYVVIASFETKLPCLTSSAVPTSVGN